MDFQWKNGRHDSSSPGEGSPNGRNQEKEQVSN